jgi:hypothetical protein
MPSNKEGGISEQVVHLFKWQPRSLWEEEIEVDCIGEIADLLLQVSQKRNSSEILLP